MHSSVAKVAVSLPKELFDSMEQARRKLKLPRSAAVVEALRAWLKKQEEEKLIHLYVEGYRKHPESRLEVREGSRHAAREFGKDPW